MGILPMSETSAGSRCHEEREYGGDAESRQIAGKSTAGNQE
jgi:hypothetical protein